MKFDNVFGKKFAQSVSLSLYYKILTTREREILHLTAAGDTARKIAERLCISPRTVEVHRANLMRKLSMHNKAEIIRYALQIEFAN